MNRDLKQADLSISSTPYNESQQSSNVRVYVEGGDKFPCFAKNGYVREYVSKLKDYYKHYSNKESGYHNISEIWSDHLIMTFSLERLYEAYALGGIDPQDSAVNMDEFYESLVSFAGIEPQEYEHMCNHLKVTKMAPGVGAYASYYGIVAVPVDGWSGSAIKGVGLGWGYPHEFGHILDSVRNVLFEVTNNVFSIKYVLDGDWYPDYVIEKPVTVTP